MLESIPPLLLKFFMTIIFSFIVGLEFHNYLRINKSLYKFGSIRTFVLIGVLGFLLYKLDSSGLFFALGLGILGVMLSVFFWQQTKDKHFTLLEMILVLLVFLIGPVAIAFPAWFLVLLVVVLILMLGEKPLIHQFSKSLANNEIVTLAKFLVISGVILPLLPEKQIAPNFPVTYYKTWLAVIVVSGFSYLSYLAQTYFFKTRGLLLTGLLGGLYSSTAISVVISRRAQHAVNNYSQVSAALIMATAMMYLRLLIIIFFLDSVAGKNLALPFITLFMTSCIIVASLLWFDKNGTAQQKNNTAQHPLELPTALLFAFMFVLFAFITQYVISHFGSHGLDFLSIMVGFTDIDPFILSLLSGKFAVTENAIVSSIIIASGSNNLLKAVYIALLARNRSVIIAVIWLIFLFISSVIYAFYFN